jgi:hypothetical protein
MGSDEAEMRGLPDTATRANAARGSVWIRTAGIGDVDCLSDHFAALSEPSRYNRFMGAVDNVSKIASDCLMQSGKADQFALVAEWRAEGTRRHHWRSELCF